MDKSFTGLEFSFDGEQGRIFKDRVLARPRGL